MKIENRQYPFKIELRGYFYTLELYDSYGRPVYDLDTAIACAERAYGPDWFSVYNGEEGIDRDSYIEGIQK